MSSTTVLQRPTEAAVADQPTLVGRAPGGAAPEQAAPAPRTAAGAPGLSSREVLVMVVERRRSADRAEADLLGLVAHLVDLHPVGVDDEVAGSWVSGDGVQLFPPGWVPVAGQGTPEVAEQVVAEVGATLGIGFQAALSLVGDTLELRHRLPALWQLVQAGLLQAWKARRVARVTRALSVGTAGFVDRQLAVGAVHNRVPANLDRVVHEALTRCEPDAAEGREQAALDARDVTFGYGRSTATCATATMTATLDTLDAIDLDNTLSDLAAAMGRLGDDSDPGVRRARALGMLADPQHTLDVFGPVGRRPLPTAVVDTGVAAGTVTGSPAAAGDGALNADRGGAQSAHPGGGSGRDGSATLDRLHRTRATVYLHLDTADLRSGHPTVSAGTSGRVERLGAATLGLLRDWLGRCEQVTIRPVLDLGRSEAVDGHDPTAAMRETVILRDGHCVFPGCGVDARSCDLDHIVPYVPLDHGGPPGQTSTTALACLCRRHHRLKTFTAWRYRRLPAGAYQWTSPDGDTFHGHPDPQR